MLNPNSAFGDVIAVAAGWLAAAGFAVAAGAVFWTVAAGFWAVTTNGAMPRNTNNAKPILLCIDRSSLGCSDVRLSTSTAQQRPSEAKTAGRTQHEALDRPGESTVE